jgi:hypothetical protein
LLNRERNFVRDLRRLVGLAKRASEVQDLAFCKVWSGSFDGVKWRGDMRVVRNQTSLQKTMYAIKPPPNYQPPAERSGYIAKKLIYDAGADV